jgi:L-asparagine transporter-like permease
MEANMVKEKFVIMVPKICLPIAFLWLVFSLSFAVQQLRKYKKEKKKHQKLYAVCFFIIAMVSLLIITSIIMATILKISFFSIWQFLITGFAWLLVIISLFVLRHARKQEKILKNP